MKLVAEPPAGLRAGLRSAVAACVTEETLDAVPHAQWRPVVLALCFAHAALRERRAYGTLGFSAPYAWTHADLRAALEFARSALAADAARAAKRGGLAPVSWHALRYVALEVHHGSHAMDPHDARIVAAVGGHWLHAALAQPDFAFARAYPLPASTELPAIHAAIDALPAVDDPAALGLGAHAEGVLLSLIHI